MMVPFPSADGAIRFRFLPFRTAKEKPAQKLTEECRSIGFSCCFVPAAAVRYDLILKKVRTVSLNGGGSYYYIEMAAESSASNAPMEHLVRAG